MCSIRCLTPGAAPGGAVGVEGLADGAVAGRVCRALEAGAREARHRGPVVRRVGPERERPLPFAVGLVEPARAGVDHAVDEELRDPAGEAAAARVAVREQRRPVVLVRLGLDPERRHDARHEVAVRLELAQELERRQVAVHRVHTGDADGREPVQRLHVEAVALRGGESGHGLLDEIRRCGFAQLPGRGAAVADDLGVLVERARPVDPGEGERARGGERGVEVDEHEECGRPVHGVVDERAVDAAVAEDVVVEPVAEHPLAGGAAPPLGGERGADVVERAGVHQVGAARVLGAHERVQVAVGDPGDDGGAVQVDDLRAGTAELPDLGVAADREHGSVADRDRGRRRQRGIERPHPPADEGKLDLCHVTPSRSAPTIVRGNHGRPSAAGAGRAAPRDRRRIAGDP